MSASASMRMQSQNQKLSRIGRQSHKMAWFGRLGCLFSLLFVFLFSVFGWSCFFLSTHWSWSSLEFLFSQAGSGLFRLFVLSSVPSFSFCPDFHIFLVFHYFGLECLLFWLPLLSPLGRISPFGSLFTSIFISQFSVSVSCPLLISDPGWSAYSSSVHSSLLEWTLFA